MAVEPLSSCFSLAASKEARNFELPLSEAGVFSVKASTEPGASGEKKMYVNPGF